MVALAALTIPDTIVLAVCLLLSVRGAVRGFAWQAVRTAGLIAALWGATRFYLPVSDWAVDRFDFLPNATGPVFAWLGIAVGVIFLFAFFAYMARGLVKSAKLGSFDRVLGLGLGAVMGLVLCAMGFVIWGQLSGEDQLRSTLEGSTSARFMAKTVEVLDPFFPESVRERFKKSLAAIEEADDD
jgi:uncharacterized membrane protein required for colicin V production